MKASQSNEGAFMEAATVEIDGIIQSLTRSNAGKIYRAGWGDIGVIAVGGISGSTITLATIDDVVGWESDMKIQLCADQSGSVYRAGGPLTVSAVNRLTGVVTFTAGVVATIGAAVVGDFTFIDGDRQNSATPVRLCLSGLEAWIPSAAPTATVFFGADRSVDPTRLGGLRYNGANIPIEETLVEAATLVGREGHKLTHFFMSFKSFSALQKTLGSKVQYVDLKITPEIGFTAIKVTGPRGPINVVPDQNCPANRVFGLNMDYIKLYSLGKPIGVIDSDGMTILRQGTADGVEARYGMYAQLGIRAPGAQINVQV
jgi:hypothetical protein